jgi:hypothetical protein
MAKAAVIYIAIPAHLQRDATALLGALQDHKVVGYPVPDPKRPGKFLWRRVPIQTVYRTVDR